MKAVMALHLLIVLIGMVWIIYRILLTRHYCHLSLRRSFPEIHTKKIVFNILCENLCSYVPMWFKVRNGHALHYRSFIQQKKTLNFSELLNLLTNKLIN